MNPMSRDEVRALMRGSRNPMAKLSEEDVQVIRQRSAKGELGSVLATEYGVSRAMISLILSGKRW
jgi:hypothetical protein